MHKVGPCDNTAFQRFFSLVFTVLFFYLSEDCLRGVICCFGSDLAELICVIQLRLLDINFHPDELLGKIGQIIEYRNSTVSVILSGLFQLFRYFFGSNEQEREILYAVPRHVSVCGRIDATYCNDAQGSTSGEN